MRYITGKHALNIKCSLDTCGDWHATALKWEEITFKESEESIYGDWGIESNRKIPNHAGVFYVANHIRAILDLIEDNKFSVAQGMKEDFICNDEYTPEILNMVWKLRYHDHWENIDSFMAREYKLEWIRFKEQLNDQELGGVDVARSNEERKVLYQLMADFLKLIKNRDYVLKGGTALMMCYGLPRFSEDIDLDGFSKGGIDVVEKFCKEKNLRYRVAKNTDTVKKYMIDFKMSKPLKIEVSYRIKNINFDTETSIINGIMVYRIENILAMKLSAYSGRDKIRDLYDVTFIGLNYWELLNDNIKTMMRNTLAYKGIEQFDYVIKEQSDELINNEELTVNFMMLWEKLGLTD